jgi:hypothetical protein
MHAMATAPERSLVRIAGGLAVALGAVGLVGYAVGVLFRGEVPLVLGYAHVGASVLELSLALPIFRKRRAAWSFLVALEGTMTVVCLLGLAQTLQAGPIGTASAAVTFARLILMLLLIVDSKEFK